jgi:hypothetical protein
MDLQEKQVIEQARAVLVTKMDSDTVIHHLRLTTVLSKAKEDELLQITSGLKRAHYLLDHLIGSSVSYFQQFRLAFMKSGHTDLAKYVNKPTDKEDEILLNGRDDNRCMLYLGGDCYVVAKEYKAEIVIHIRNYIQRGAKKYPTKHGVMFNILRWLMLEMNRDEINKVFQNGMSGKLEQNHELLIHLGGGLYLTVGYKFPTVDIRHFWKPIDSDNPVPTKRGIALNQYRWNGLQNVMDLIRDFVPELAPSVICEYTHHAQPDLLKCHECSPFIENDDVEEEEATF